MNFFQPKNNKPKIKKQPAFMAAAGADDPLADVDYTDDLEADSAAELDALKAGFRARHAKEQDRLTNAVDSEYWVAVCFKSRAHKDHFIAALHGGARLWGDKYLDGHQLARHLGFDVEGDQDQ